MTPVNPSSTHLQVKVIIQVAKQTNSQPWHCWPQPHPQSLPRRWIDSVAQVVDWTPLYFLILHENMPAMMVEKKLPRLHSWVQKKGQTFTFASTGSSSSSSSTSTSVNYEVVCDPTAYFPQRLGPLTRLRRQWPGHIRSQSCWSIIIPLYPVPTSWFN